MLASTDLFCVHVQASNVPTPGKHATKQRLHDNNRNAYVTVPYMKMFLLYYLQLPTPTHSLGSFL